MSTPSNTEGVPYHGLKTWFFWLEDSEKDRPRGGRRACTCRASVPSRNRLVWKQVLDLGFSSSKRDLITQVFKTISGKKKLVGPAWQAEQENIFWDVIVSVIFPITSYPALLDTIIVTCKQIFKIIVFFVNGLDMFCKWILWYRWYCGILHGTNLSGNCA